MNINGGFFANTEGDALMEMQKIVGCNVKRCSYPTTKNLTYYISEHGHLFSIQNIQGKMLVRGPKQPGSRSAHGKRRDGGTTLRLNNGKHGKGGESWIAAELLVYCTFIIGRWEPGLRIDFKNGRASDLRPDNLEIHREAIPPEWAERLARWEDIYESQFNTVVKHCTWWTGISREDARDVVQSTYIWLCTTGYRSDPTDFVKVWTYWAKLRAHDFWRHHQTHYTNEDYDTILEMIGQRDKPVEVDLFHIQNGEKRSQYLTLWAQGHTPTEIAEMTGSTTGNVGSSVTRSIQFLQKYFRYEKEMLRP